MTPSLHTKFFLLYIVECYDSLLSPFGSDVHFLAISL
jgi:hypothetical protein